MEVRLLKSQQIVHNDEYARAASFSLAHATPEARPRSATLKSMTRPWWLSEQYWPFSTLSLDVEGHRIAVTDVGQGPTLLFIHTGFWSFIWRDVIKLLSRDFRCVCFDSPGTGLSERLPIEDISLTRASRVATAVIEALELEELTLVVHDLGGPVGIAGAAERPERISAIAAVNTFAWRPNDWKLRLMLNFVGSSPVRELDAFTNLLPATTASNFGVGLHFDDSDRRIFRRGIGRQGLRAFHKYLSDAAASEGLYQKATAALKGPFRDLPVITIFGERNDPFRFQPRWKAFFPGVRQLVIKKGNHFPMCDDPKLVAATLHDWRLPY